MGLNYLVKWNKYGISAKLHLHMQGAIKGDELLESHNGTEENAYK
jgi:hypothetical protein